MGYNYIAYIYSGLSEPSADRFEDGKKLASECCRKIQKLDDPEHFPPHLFILFAAPAFMDYSTFLAGIQNGLAEYHMNDVPLIGSSVGGCVFDNNPQPNGAVLICFASRLLNVQVAVSPNARDNPEQAVKELIKQTDLSGFLGINTRGRPMFMVFMPGYGEGKDEGTYYAREIHRHLRELTLERISIFGGVSSIMNRRKAGYQFLGRHSYKDAIVAALIEIGNPVAMGMWDGLKSSGRYIHVTKLSDDKETILEFTEGTPQEVLKPNQFILLRQITPSGEKLIALPKLVQDGKGITLLRKIDDDATLEIMYVEKDTILKTSEETVKRSLQRMKIQNVGGFLVIACIARFEYIKEMGIDLKNAIKWSVEKYPGIPLIGVYMDGEAGVDISGRSVFGNWTINSLTIGDEIQERAIIFRGFEELSQHQIQTSKEGLVNETINWALDLIWNAGFPGAMISLVYESVDKRYIIAQNARGSRFKKIVEHTKRELPGDDVLALVSLEKKARFIKDSTDRDKKCNLDAILISGLISQYIIPLLDARGNVLATLQIDLGDMKYLKELPETLRHILDSLGAAIASVFSQAFQTEELEFTRNLDKALAESLLLDDIEKALNNFIKCAAETLHVPRAHIRIYDKETNTLCLIAGVGEYYKVAQKKRPVIDVQERSTTALAFRKGEIIVVNDMSRNVDRQKIKQLFQNSEIGQVLKDNKSYTNMPIKDSLGIIIGVINLSSDKSWFFSQSHIRSIQDIGEKLGFLVEFFRRKEAEKLAAEIATKRASELNFLLKATPHLAPGGNASFISALNIGICELRKISNADFISLFIWDEDLHCYILRAQEGWAHPEWIDSARYASDEGWTGSIALQREPRYVGSLKDFKKEKRIPWAKYGDHQFFPPIRDDETVEVIGIPLWIGDRPLGILTIHRRKSKKLVKQFGFTTKDQNLLKEVSDNLSAFIAAMQWYDDTTYQARSAECTTKITDILSRGTLNVLDDVCKEIANYLQTSVAAVYLFEEKENCLSLKSKCVRPSEKVNVETNIKENNDNPVWMTYRDKPWTKLRICSKDEKQESNKLKLEGLIERCCFPLKVSENILGILDIQWDLNSIDINTHHQRYIIPFLRTISERIASSIHVIKLQSEREEAQEREKQSGRKVDGMAATVFQSAHRLGNLLQNVASLTSDIINSHKEKERKDFLTQMRDLVNKGIKEIPRPLDLNVVTGVLKEERQKVSLSLLWQQAIEQSPIPESVKVVNSLSEKENDFTLLVNPNQIIQVFHNVISNAVNSIQEKNVPGILTVYAKALKGNKFVEIVIADTGKGMTEDQIKAAKIGFTQTRDGYGVGVLLSILLCRANDGDLDIRSQAGSGTEIIIKLPLSREVLL